MANSDSEAEKLPEAVLSMLRKYQKYNDKRKSERNHLKSCIMRPLFSTIAIGYFEKKFSFQISFLIVK